MANSIESIYMVEASPELKQTQQRLLCSPETDCTKDDSCQRGTSRHFEKPIVWVDSIKSIPTQADKVPFIVAHEFFDALPIHIFQSARTSPTANFATKGSSGASQATAEGLPALEWREMMISPTSPAAKASAKAAIPGTDQGKLLDEFQLILSSKPTRHSRYLPESSPRYSALKQTEGSVVEVCPDASLYAADFATRIGGSAKNPKVKGSGAALILDYGTSDTVPINSLRGIRQHKLVSPFSEPGLVDLSVDVDFTAVAEAATLASDGVEVHGPVSQADFLELMGIRERAEILVKSAGVGTPTAQSIEKSWKRLVDRGPNGMGKVYKALAILPENDGRRRPVGFGGDISRG